jgi:serine/threonine-protein kinase
VASAAYGEDWEERGRGQLARRASLLLFLFPLAGLDGGGTAIATSWLTRGRVVAAAVVVTVLAGGGYAAARISGSPTGATARHGAASFSYSARPSGPAPSPASPPGSSSLPRPHPSSSAGSTSSGAPPSPATRTPTPTETATTTSHHVPPPPHTSTTVKPPAQQVHVVITSFAGAATAESVLHVHVDTTTTAPVTLTIRYFGGKTKSTPGAQDGATVTIPLSGATSYDSGDKHVWTVDGTGCPPDVWFVQVTSTPAAGNGTQQTYTGAPICP